jgi:hypothetical protein
MCLLGDLLATKKVAGFAAPTATSFCSWCHAKCQSLQTLQIAESRTKNETIQASKEFKDAPSENAQKNMLKETGV